MKKVASARDVLLFGLEAGERHLREIIADISATEYYWEPLSPSAQAADRCLPPERKRVWRVFQIEERWTYDYTTEAVQPPPFTTIAWIMNHVAQTADMYLYCIKTGQAEGVERTWDDLPVFPHVAAVKQYLDETLAAVHNYLVAIPSRQINLELNKLTPAPWGELRPTYLNIWGGVIEHVIQHAVQLAARKDMIRYGV